MFRNCFRRWWLRMAPDVCWWWPGPFPISTALVGGIGIGLTQYLKLIAAFPTEVPVYLVTWPHVSMQIEDRVPTINDNVETIAQTLRRDGVSKACFVGHSLGTTAVAWMLHDRDAAPLVSESSLA